MDTRSRLKADQYPIANDLSVGKGFKGSGALDEEVGRDLAFAEVVESLRTEVGSFVVKGRLVFRVVVAVVVLRVVAIDDIVVVMNITFIKVDCVIESGSPMPIWFA